jgi:hypothetical protein
VTDETFDNTYPQGYIRLMENNVNATNARRPRRMTGTDHGRRYNMVQIENVVTGANMGHRTFDRIETVPGNDNVWDVVYGDGIRYTETRGAWVRIYA